MVCLLNYIVSSIPIYDKVFKLTYLTHRWEHNIQPLRVREDFREIALKGYLKTT